MEEEKYDNLGGRTGIRGGFTAKERLQAQIETKKCSRCGRPNTSHPQSLVHARVTCSACSQIINNDLYERYFAPSLEKV